MHRPQDQAQGNRLQDNYFYRSCQETLVVSPVSEYQPSKIWLFSIPILSFEREERERERPLLSLNGLGTAAALDFRPLLSNPFPKQKEERFADRRCARAADRVSASKKFQRRKVRHSQSASFGMATSRHEALRRKSTHGRHGRGRKGVGVALGRLARGVLRLREE